VLHARARPRHPRHRQRPGLEAVAADLVRPAKAVAAGLAGQLAVGELQPVLLTAWDARPIDRHDLPAGVRERGGRKDRAAASLQGAAVGRHPHSIGIDAVAHAVVALLARDVDGQPPRDVPPPVETGPRRRRPYRDPASFRIVIDHPAALDRHRPEGLGAAGDVSPSRLRVRDGGSRGEGGEDQECAICHAPAVPPAR
jgi:hypothetical protein